MLVLEKLGILVMSLGGGSLISQDIYGSRPMRFVSLISP